MTLMTEGKLVFIGLGLYDEKDITLRGMEALNQADIIFAECYTSKLIGSHIKDLEKTIGKPITLLNRHETEDGTKILQAASQQNVAFLVCGDPMMATTHVELRLQAIQKHISTEIIHNGSIITAVPGLLGLQNYKFGRTTTLAYPEKNYFPTSPYQVIKDNKRIGLHTLVLLDIQEENNRYMTANEALDLLLRMEEEVKEKILSQETLACVVARAGSPDCVIIADTLASLQKKEFGPPLHSLVIPGTLHFMEVEALESLAGLPAHISQKFKKV